MSKLVAVIPLDGLSMDEAEKLLQEMFAYAEREDMISEDVNWVLIEGLENQGATLH